MSRARSGIMLATLAALAGCGEKIDAVQPAACTATGEVTYQGQIKPILDTLCAGCHASTLSGSARNGAPTAVDLDTYDEAAKHAAGASARIQNESMPPSGTKASPAQKELVTCWISGGLKEGP